MLAFVGLLALVVAVFSLAAYRAARQGALLAAGARMEGVAAQIAGLLSESVESFVAEGSEAAADARLGAALSQGSPAALAGARALLDSLAAANDEVRGVELHAADGSLVAAAGPVAEAAEAAPAAPRGPRGPGVSPFHRYGFGLGFAVSVPVGEGRGYLLYHVALTTSPEEVRRVSELIGERVALFVGVPGAIWTDLVQEVPPPPDGVDPMGPTTDYLSSRGERVLGAGSPIAGTPWVSRLEIPLAIVLAAPRELLARLVPLGLLVLAGGAAAGLALSLPITRRLRRLSHAAAAMSAGQYQQRVPDQGDDELGDLARAFNRMAAQVEGAYDRLEEEVARHRLLFQHIADAILVFDHRGVVRFASASMGEVLGLEPDDLLGRPSLEHVHPDDHEPADRAFRRLMDRPDAVENVEVRMRHADGSWRPMDCVLRNLLHREGIGGVVVTCRDITERKRLEAEVRQAQKLESIGRLAGGIAHDFNNLLTAILGHTEFLLESDLGPHQRADLEEVHRAGDRATRLTRQLLAFSRRQVLDLRLVDLNRVVSELTPMLTRLLGEPVSIVTALADGLGTVRADEGQIEQVVVNLAVNARDAMPQGGRLTIRTAVTEVGEGSPRTSGGLAPGTYARLTVEDTGSGMDADTQARLFDPFFTTKPEGEGTGLGLATVYGIVKQSGGTIFVESAPGRGTRFDIFLPRLDAPPDERASRSRPVRLPRGSESVLVLEDDDTVRDLAVRALRQHGYDVLEASSGRDAHRYLDDASTTIHLLLTDAVLPDRNGKAVARDARRARPGLPVLFMSGYAAASLDAQGVLEPGDALVHKPFTPAELVEAVRRVLDQPRP